MRVTEKEQVTIPKELRDALGIGAGTEVEFERRRDVIVVRKAKVATSRGQRASRHLHRGLHGSSRLSGSAPGRRRCATPALTVGIAVALPGRSVAQLRHARQAAAGSARAPVPGPGWRGGCRSWPA